MMLCFGLIMSGIVTVLVNAYRRNQIRDYIVVPLVWFFASLTVVTIEATVGNRSYTNFFVFLLTICLIPTLVMMYDMGAKGLISLGKEG